VADLSDRVTELEAEIEDLKLSHEDALADLRAAKAEEAQGAAAEAAKKAEEEAARKAEEEAKRKAEEEEKRKAEEDLTVCEDDRRMAARLAATLLELIRRPLQPGRAKVLRRWGRRSGPRNIRRRRRFQRRRNKRFAAYRCARPGPSRSQSNANG
jgi:septal ring factor EnvC (AmiA/AmiB activator)